MVSDKGGRAGFVYRTRWDTYRALRRKGMPKSKAARISNAGLFRPGRVRMARKAARTRRMRGRR
ncbi:hypothetical protein M2155_000601 [Streptomyces sp. SAI-119]|uniref:DUF7218 family protein n=1 Tax=Streptomyces sp. SAI-119 TaxID=2940541 RepID=UPI0024767418|nr:hypothetical protein [Streptomyces sp. SAI-119]MDH6448193.1 hypothetical protein [Streptomyces sp. SAI-119]